uniref:Lon N-terminal domain-containing protein n=1 Tax=Skeletonema marinoi TaxID=267567 RepID=A0A7S2M8Z9_9STRA|mmetsp:Transcript_5961/g.9951  ORF Transcript_5961/g.9951 Transcript_5961/m.9951 type:complete len:456 (+) Transcript_5961:122-1489(+)
MTTLNFPTLRFLLAATIATSPFSTAFLPPSSQPHQITTTTSTTQLHGIQEWRDQAYSDHYTLDAYTPSTPPSIPATIPILPFPFTDIFLQGQRKQLNLYEQRFHSLFSDALSNHHGMVGMGLLLGGKGMITTMPLCEVESFTRFGQQEDWVDNGNGMGNGSIFVTIRAVGRARIVESDLIQEEPYIKARVVEVLDEEVCLEVGDNGIKEMSGSGEGGEGVVGESSPVQVGSLIASTIENMLVSLSSMEHKLSMVKATTSEEESGDDENVGKSDNENDDGVMNKRLEAARLEELFMKDSSEGVDLESNKDTTSNEEEDEEEEEDDDYDDSEILDRVAQFQQAFEDAKETDNQGYILQPTTATDNLSKDEQVVLRSPKDLTAISWAAFCTGPKDNSKESIKRQAIQIQALDMTNVIQRMQLAAAMLREEQNSLKAKLALAGIQDIFRGGDGGVIGDE